jgi:hypothetical protein
MTGAGAMLRMLLAAAVLAGQMLAPGMLASMDRAMAAEAATAGPAPICDTDPAATGMADDGPTHHPTGHHHYCTLCPFCHCLTPSALLPAATGVEIPLLLPIACAAAAPPATGPPSQARYSTASPRGPPALSA